MHAEAGRGQARRAEAGKQAEAEKACMQRQAEGRQAEAGRQTGRSRQRPARSGRLNYTMRRE